MIFDTNCVLCSGFVQFILKHERDEEIIFVNAWSKNGLEIAAKFGLDEAALNQTYLVVSDGVGFTKSDAGMIIISYVIRPWNWLRFLRLIPRPIRDFVYSTVAKRRYNGLVMKKAA